MSEYGFVAEFLTAIQQRFPSPDPKNQNHAIAVDEYGSLELLVNVGGRVHPCLIHDGDFSHDPEEAAEIVAATLASKLEEANPSHYITFRPMWLPSVKKESAFFVDLLREFMDHLRPLLDEDYHKLDDPNAQPAISICGGVATIILDNLSLPLSDYPEPEWWAREFQGLLSGRWADRICRAPHNQMANSSDVSHAAQ
jgi:hypothetical protein